VGFKISALMLLTAMAWGQSFPEGPGKDLFQLNCSFCHEPTFVLDKTLSKAEWQSLVTDMLQQEKVSQQEQDVIAGYLAKNYPKRVNVNEAAAGELRSILEITPAQAAAIVASRQVKGALRSVDDLKKILGFDEKKLEEVRNRILF
jgi:competence ComEA-like helix-hairpin-helix protein